MNTVDIIKELGVIVTKVKVLPELLHVDTSYIVDELTDHDELLVAARKDGHYYIIHGLHEAVPAGELINVWLYNSSGASEEKVFYTFIHNLLHKEPIAAVPAPTTFTDINSLDFKEIV